MKQLTCDSYDPRRKEGENFFGLICKISTKALKHTGK